MLVVGTAFAFAAINLPSGHSTTTSIFDCIPSLLLPFIFPFSLLLQLLDLRCVVVTFVQSEFSNRRMLLTKVEKIVSHTQKLPSIQENDKEYIDSKFESQRRHFLDVAGLYISRLSL